MNLSVLLQSVVSIATVSATSTTVFQRIGGSNINGCCAPGANSTDGNVVYAGKTDTSSECESKCAADADCMSYTWEANVGAVGSTAYHQMCYLRHDQVHLSVSFIELLFVFSNQRYRMHRALSVRKLVPSMYDTTQKWVIVDELGHQSGRKCNGTSNPKKPFALNWCSLGTHEIPNWFVIVPLRRNTELRDYPVHDYKFGVSMTRVQALPNSNVCI